MQLFSDYRSWWSKGPQWENDCSSFLPCFLLEGRFEFVLPSSTYASVVRSTWPSHAMWRTHAPTFNKWQKKKRKNKNKKVTLHVLTRGAIWGYVLTSLAVCINDKFCDIKERNVTIRSKIWTRTSLWGCWWQLKHNPFLLCSSCSLRASLPLESELFYSNQTTASYDTDSCDLNQSPRGLFPTSHAFVLPLIVSPTFQKHAPPSFFHMHLSGIW